MVEKVDSSSNGARDSITNPACVSEAGLDERTFQTKKGSEAYLATRNRAIVI